MSRADAWVDSDQQEKDGQLEVLYDKPGGVDVYRARNSASSTGFSAEVKEPTFAKTIVARMDRSRDYPDRATDKDANIQRPLLALTDDKDVRDGDIWRWHDLAGRPQWHRVLSTEAIQAGTNIILDELRKTAWPNVTAE